MKQTYLKSLFLSLLMIVVGGNLASAQEADLTLDFTSAWESNGTNSFKTTIDGAEYVISGSGTNFKFNDSGYFYFGKSGAYIDLPKVNFDVEKIVVVGNSNASASVKMNLFVGDVAVSTETTGSTGTNTYEIAEDYQAANNQYRLKVTSSHNAQITYIKYYKKSSGPVSVTGISLDATEAKLMVGKTRSLTATIVPANATNKTVNWTSSDETVATVTDGVVTAVAEGDAIITATSAENSNINATCEVTVIGELNETTATGNLNNSATGVFAGQQGFNTGAHSVSGTLVTDAGNVTVDYAGTSSTYLNDNHIRMYKNGSTLKFTAPTGYTLTKIVLTKTQSDGGEYSYIKSEQGSYSSGTWTGDEEYVTFTGIGDSGGTLRLASSEVTLEKATPKSPLVSIAVEGPKTEFAIGEEFVFGGTVTATYESGNTKDVTAQAGFTGYDMSQSGEQTVTVSYTEDEVTKTATYNITVNAVAVTGISLDVIEATLVVGQTKKINATIVPDNATNKELVWTSEDESVATVDQDGEVTAVGVGTIIIKAAAADNNDIFGECTIHVVELKTEPYSLVTNVSDLAEGDEVIIVNTEAGKAMSTTQNSNNRGAADVTIQDNKALVPNTGEIQVFTLEGNTEGWYFYTGSGYIYAASNSSNQLKTQTTKDNNAKAVITINEEGTSVVFQRKDGRNTLQYNPNTANNNPIFTCYESASQYPVQIYKKGATSAATYSLVVGEEETPFENLTLTKELPAHTKFYIKDNKDNEYHSADAQSELIIIAENHENLPTSADGKDFYLKKANTWVFTLTEASDGLMLTVSPETEGETKYMLSGYLQESNDVFDENLKLTKEMTSTTEEFYFTRSDDYGLTNLTPTTFNAPEDRRYWIFSEDDPTVEFIAGEIRGSYTVGEVGTYTFTIDLTNNTISVEKIPTTYTLVTVDETLTEYPFSGLTLTQELPAHTKFYIKDNKGNEYHSADAQSELIIIAENHENLPTSADGKDFYLKKANTWVFTLTEASDGLMLTVSPETEGETKYMLSGYLQESDDVFDENLKLTKEMTSTTEEFYFTRSDDYGLTNLTPATFNAPEDRRYWIFSEEDPTVEFIAGEIRGSYTVGEEGTYTFTIDLTNNTVTAEKTVEYVDLTISSYEWATFVTPSAVQFPDDVTAYIITEITGGNAKAEQITEAPAGTPVIVNGTAGVHKLLKVEDAVLDYTNMLQVSDGNVTGDGTIYVLAVEGGQAGFAPLANGKKLSAGKAYLQVDNASGAKINFVIDDATDIRGIESTVDFSDGDWYNLQGVKVTNPQRGIYIHNGKKVVIK